jgi:uncharacterized cupredoxin-like copper-binding protein
VDDGEPGSGRNPPSDPDEADVIRLAAAAGCVAVAAVLFNGVPDRTIEIDIEHSRFLPARIDVAAGQKVRFVIHNGDPIDHEFIVGDERVQAIHEKGTEAHHGSRPGEVSIEALGEATTTYTFTQPGTLLIGCHLPNHYDYGMRGVVVIE